VSYGDDSKLDPSELNEKRIPVKSGKIGQLYRRRAATPPATERRKRFFSGNPAVFRGYTVDNGGTDI